MHYSCFLRASQLQSLLILCPRPGVFKCFHAQNPKYDDFTKIYKFECLKSQDQLTNYEKNIKHDIIKATFTNK